MKVRELINKLLKEAPDATVVLQRDEEGNGYSVLSSIDSSFFDPNDGEPVDTQAEGGEGTFAAIFLVPSN